MGFDSLNDLWNTVCQECVDKNLIAETGYNVWLKEVFPVSVESGKLILGVSSNYNKQIIEMHYKDILENVCQEITGLNLNIEIKVVLKDNMSSTSNDFSKTDINSIYTFNNFIVGSSNRFAHAAAMAVAENPSILYNPLFLYGNSGVGKTHLMLAIKNHIIKKFPNKKIEFIRGEQFTNSLIDALHNGTINLFHQRFRSVDVLLMDDIHFIAGKDATQEEFFNTFNALHQENKQIVVTSDRPPKEIQTLDERIRSRLESGLLADMEPPDFETRVGIIFSKAEQFQVKITDDVAYYIAEQIKMNTRQLEGVIKKLKAYSTMNNNQNLSLVVVQGFIKDIVNNSVSEPVTVEKIVNEVSRTYSVSSDYIFSTRRNSEVTFARQISMYIVRELTLMSYDEIGKNFNRDHSTVLHSINKIQETFKEHPHHKKIVDDIIKNLQN